MSNLVYPEGDVSEASLLSGIFHQLPVHGPELVKLICDNTNTHRSAIANVPVIRHLIKFSDLIFKMLSSFVKGRKGFVEKHVYNS